MPPVSYDRQQRRGIFKNWILNMFQNEVELRATQERIARFQQQLAHLRKVETNATAFRLSSSGFIAKIDRMRLEVREYLGLLPTELTKGSNLG